MAMIFVALMIHGIRPGPMLIQEHPELFWGVIASMFVGNTILLALNLPLIGVWVKLLSVPYRYLVVVIVVICIIGAYSVNYTSFDVGAMVIFGGFGYLIRKARFPATPMVLAMILGPILERSLQQSLIMAGGNFMIFLRRPLSGALLAVAGLLMLTPVARRLWKKGRGVQTV
jgi:putative tricarboxylic transport membrane protein